MKSKMIKENLRFSSPDHHIHDPRGGVGGGVGCARQHHSARNAIARRANLIARDAWRITLIPLPAIIALLRPLPPSHLLTVSSRLYGPHKVLSHRVNPSRAAPLNYICLLCFARRGGG